MPYKMKKVTDRHDQLVPAMGFHEHTRMTSAKQLLYSMNGLISGEAASKEMRCFSKMNGTWPVGLTKSRTSHWAEKFAMRPWSFSEALKTLCRLSKIFAHTAVHLCHWAGFATVN
jgi:hypothetical protein